MQERGGCEKGKKKKKKKGKIRVTNWELQALSTIAEFWPSISLPFKPFFTFHQIHFLSFL